ncbi:4'-phosphopantetheinyl transferase family protein [Glaciecola siphonariae]|uniref:4'-phosphopantetheinyl transferase family protein n=1 Tax=Glaciecola siphonariae TaxID=521012 RepID=A0ABV9LUL9_9ALTE
MIDSQSVISHRLVDEYKSVLSEAENARMLSFKSTQRQQQYLIARASLRFILSSYLPSISPQAVNLNINRFGKPLLGDNDNKLHFNVSHSQDKILIGIASDRRIGVDIEHINAKRNVERIAEHYFHPREWHCDALPSVDSVCYFYKLWTLKEAFVKAEGKGRVVIDSSIYFDLTYTDKPRLCHSDSQKVISQWAFAHKMLLQDYSLSVAKEVASEDDAIEISLTEVVPQHFTSHEKSWSLKI